MTNPNRLDTDAARSLRTFAEQYGEFAFAHLVTAALAGEEWAVGRMIKALKLIDETIGSEIDWQRPGNRTISAARITVIRATDTTRPDGNIARAAVEV